jgi:predicted ester cyclase
MELNREIICQLYKEVTSEKRPDPTITAGNNGLTRHTVSTRPYSLNAFYSFFAAVGKAFPDYELKLDNLIVRGNRVMTRYTISGTHKGDFMGLAATNERMAITGIDAFRLDEGKVIEHWDAAHQIAALPQLPADTRTPFSGRHPRGVTNKLSPRTLLSLSV